MPLPDHIRKKLSMLPHRPGIYLMKDRFGTVIYVGKRPDLRKRVSQYSAARRMVGPEFRGLTEAICDFDVHGQEDRSACAEAYQGVPAQIQCQFPR